MNYYQLTVEGVFFRVQFSSQAMGFFATLYVAAESAVKASERVQFKLKSMMKAAGVAPVLSREFCPHLIVSDIYQITEERYREKHEFDHGFNFYEIGPLDKVKLVVRFAYLRAFHQWKILQVYRNEGIPA